MKFNLGVNENICNIVPYYFLAVSIICAALFTPTKILGQNGKDSAPPADVIFTDLTKTQDVQVSSDPNQVAISLDVSDQVLRVIETLANRIPEFYPDHVFAIAIGEQIYWFCLLVNDTGTNLLDKLENLTPESSGGGKLQNINLTIAQGGIVVNGLGSMDDLSPLGISNQIRTNPGYIYIQRSGTPKLKLVFAGSKSEVIKNALPVGIIIHGFSKIKLVTSKKSPSPKVNIYKDRTWKEFINYMQTGTQLLPPAQSTTTPKSSISSPHILINKAGKIKHAKAE